MRLLPKSGPKDIYTKEYATHQKTQEGGEGKKSRKKNQNLGQKRKINRTQERRAKGE